MKNLALWIVFPPFVCLLIVRAGCLYLWDQVRLWIRPPAVRPHENHDYSAVAHLGRAKDLRDWPKKAREQTQLTPEGTPATLVLPNGTPKPTSGGL